MALPALRLARLRLHLLPRQTLARRSEMTHPLEVAHRVGSGLDVDRLITDRTRLIDASGIRRAFELGASLKDPINLSIGQPDFPVDERVKQAAIRAVSENLNGYSLTQGVPELRSAVWKRLESDVGWSEQSGSDLIITSGTTGALALAIFATVADGDEVIMPDPYFVAYPQMVKVAGGRSVLCDTYPDFRMTAARVEPLLTPRTKMVIIDSPSNPCGVVLTQQELDDLARLCRERNVLLVADEIYDAFTFPDALECGRCPSAARTSASLLLVRGFGKSYGCTGWRLGYAAGPTALIQQMAKLQQYLFVCAPTPLQVAAAECYSVDLSALLDRYVRRRDMVVDALRGVVDIVVPQGAFYAFIPVTDRGGGSGTAFARRVIDHRLIVVPGYVFSARDSHFRISFAAPEEKLAAGLQVIRQVLKSG
jgi:aspartate/methionine/tyrosine aminotransferase